MKPIRKPFVFLFILCFVLLGLINCRARVNPVGVTNLKGKMVVLALSLTGLPYRYGGEDLDGYDCSGFVYYVYDCFGVKIPRTAKQQARLKRKIRLGGAEPGDILVFKLKRRRHTAIYLGDNRFIHAPNKRSRVRIEQLNGFWKKRLKGVIRVVDN
ncbi:MAG: C40 family peptidase [bacterium]|nr:C40 family peptidase [bacterium]